jgi:sulfopyruvate decarboxylase subunit beta
MLMQPEDVLRAIAQVRGDAVVVPTMTASPAWRLIAPDDLSVNCVGFMGGASSLGLGIALAQPERRVIVLDGDGSLLMQLGSLATVAGVQPHNFTHLLFKNGVYHTSGSQETPGGARVDFAAMARAAGYRNAYTFDNLEEFRIRLPEILAEDGPVLVQLLTGEAELTPMTAPGGAPFSTQVADLRRKLLGIVGGG